jgi:hypothetical protein
MGVVFWMRVWKPPAACSDHLHCVCSTLHRDLCRLMKHRSAAEETYAKSLLKLSKQKESNYVDIGETRAAYTLVREELKSTADAHAAYVSGVRPSTPPCYPRSFHHAAVSANVDHFWPPRYGSAQVC